MLLAPLTIVLVLIGLSRSTPSWWSPADARLPSTLSRAEVVENGFLSQVSLVRPQAPSSTPEQTQSWRSEDWRMSLKEEDANAWLAARLPRWIANRLRGADPSAIPPAQVRFLDRRVSLAFELAHSGRRQIVAFSFTPFVDEGGAIWARELSISAGRVTIPASWSRSLIDFRSPALAQAFSNAEFARRLAALLDESESLLQDAYLPLDDGRRVRLLELTPQPDRLVFRCRTEKSPAP